jgi:hypothetical protein
MPVFRHKRIGASWVTKFCIGENCAVLNRLKNNIKKSSTPDNEV